MKVASKVQNDEPLSSLLSFSSGRPEPCSVTDAKEFLDPKIQQRIYQDRTSRSEKEHANN